MYSRFILQKLLKAKGQEINQRQKTKTKKNATYILIAAPQLQKQMSVGLLWKTVSVFSQGMISHEVFNLIMRSAFKDENTQQQINDWKKIKKISVVSVTSSDLGQIELGDIYRISTITMYSFQISWSLLICLKTPPIWDHMTVNWKITLPESVRLLRAGVTSQIRLETLISTSWKSEETNQESKVVFSRAAVIGSCVFA